MTTEFAVKVRADSTAPHGGRITTMELTYPRCIHAEFMTHRMFSRNAASSRAIPITKYLDRVERAPFVPLRWGRNQAGMQAGDEHDDPKACRAHWLSACREAVAHARVLARLGLHKQIVNRVVEPWAWITVIATGVDHAWENFFHLRCSPAAEPHICHLATMARAAYDGSTPTKLGVGRWHLPFFGFPGDEVITVSNRPMVAVARCARVSYLTHEGNRDVQEDLRLHSRLVAGGHWSPFEHVAMASDDTRPEDGGNLGPGWVQYRKLYLNEYCMKAARPE